MHNCPMSTTEIPTEIHPNGNEWATDLSAFEGKVNGNVEAARKSSDGSWIVYYRTAKRSLTKRVRL